MLDNFSQEFLGRNAGEGTGVLGPFGVQEIIIFEVDLSWNDHRVSVIIMMIMFIFLIINNFISNKHGF